jgi:CelD/BcsL family acetyltransferase involved in cellulose biosynthesis
MSEPPMVPTPAHWAVVPLQGPGLGEHFEAWQSLAQVLYPHHPMLDAAFVNALLLHYPEPKLYLAQLFEGKRLTGLSLLRRRVRGSGLWCSFLPMNAQMGCSLLPANAPLNALLQALPGHGAQLDLLCNDPAFGDQRGPADTLRRVKQHALTMHIDLRGSAADYWQKRPRKLVQNLGRYQRRAVQLGHRMSLLRHTEPEAVAAAVVRYGQLEESGWKGAQGTAMSAGSVQARFYADLMQCLQRQGQARVYELWCDNTLVASRLVAITPKMAVMLKTAYLETHDHLAPGRQLLKMVIDELFAEGSTERMEFYTDANADLMAWATGQRWISHVEAYRHRVAKTWLESVRKARHWRSLERQDDERVRVDRVHPAKLPDDVRQLLAGAEPRHIELGSDWLALLTRNVFPEESSTSVYVLRYLERPVAALPVHLANPPHGSVEALSNYYTAFYEPVLGQGVGGHELLALLRAVRKEHPQAALHRYAPMDPDSPAFEALTQALRMAHFKTFAFFCFGNWYEPVRQNWADYLASRSGQIRSTLKRTGKKFAAEGGRLELVTGGPELASRMQAFEQVYASSWKTAEPYPNFVRELAELCAKRGWLRLGLAWLNDRPIAAQLWYVNGGRACIYKLAYDENHKTLGAGTLLTALLMEQVLDKDGVQEIDYLIGDDTYKASWMSQRRERWGLVAYNLHSARGLLLWLRACSVKALKKYLPSAWVQRLRRGGAAASAPPAAAHGPAPPGPPPTA